MAGLRWPYVDLEVGELRVWFQLQRLPWQHGCSDAAECCADQLLAETGRTTTKPIARFKVRKPEPPRQRHPAQGSAIWH